MSTITFSFEFLDRINDNIVGIFDYTNPFTDCRASRKFYFSCPESKLDNFRDLLKPYIQFMIDHNMLNESILTLGQKKYLTYIIFKYPKSYPNGRKGVPPGIGRYFSRINYDRYCLNKDSSNDLQKKNDKMASKYPSRLLAPGSSGVTTLLMGSSFSGKTYLLIQELNLIKPFIEYDLIVMFTESINVPGLEKIKERPDVLMKEGFNSSIPEFLKKLNSALGLRFKFLLILDDIISEKSSRKSTLGAMITTYRNSNISSIVLLQYPTLIEKCTRSNFHRIIITGMRSSESNQALCSRFDICTWAKKRMILEGDDGKITKDDIYEYLKKLLMTDGMVLYIDLKKSLDPSLINLAK
jgi:hypothetical protein